MIILVMNPILNCQDLKKKLLQCYSQGYITSKYNQHYALAGADI